MASVVLFQALLHQSRAEAKLAPVTMKAPAVKKQWTIMVASLPSCWAYHLQAAVKALKLKRVKKLL